MPRARNIKPSLFTNEILGTLDPFITILFIGLWCLADKEGILEDRPLRIKGEIFPYREKVDVNGYLTVLEQKGFIQRYSSGGKGYIFVIEFAKHQSPHHTEKAKGFPKPPNKQVDTNVTVTTPLDNQLLTVGTRSDSLIPDSLIPDSNPLSGKPDFVLSNGKQKFKDDAIGLIAFLNEKSGKHFRPVKVNVDLIASRLKDGASVQDCKSMIAMMIRKWKGTDAYQYIRPETLFRASKFEGYIGELHHD